MKIYINGKSQEEFLQERREKSIEEEKELLESRNVIYKGKLLKIEEIDEFNRINEISKSDVPNYILNKVKEFHEIDQIEKILREIIKDFNQTSHDSMEVSDILTTNIHITQIKTFSAFILKGKASNKVKSKTMGNQILKLARIPNLKLACLVFTGILQDDALIDFMNIADKFGYNYLLIDKLDLARLFIAYSKICLRDGTPFNDQKLCQFNHSKCLTFQEFYDQAILLRNEKNYNLALKYLLSALNLKSCDFNTLYNIGITFRDLNEYEKALEWLLKAKEFRINDFFVLYNIGVTYRDLGLYLDALNTFEQAQKIDPKNNILIEIINETKKNLGIC